MAAQLALRASEPEGGEETAVKSEVSSSAEAEVVREGEPSEQEVARAEREEEKLEEALLSPPAANEAAKQDQARS